MHPWPTAYASRAVMLPPLIELDGAARPVVRLDQVLISVAALSAYWSRLAELPAARASFDDPCHAAFGALLDDGSLVVLLCAGATGRPRAAAVPVLTLLPGMWSTGATC